MPRIEQTITIHAPLETVYRIARDVESFPSIMSDLKSLTVLERNPENTRTVTEWVGLVREFKMQIRWTQEDVWDEAAGRDTFKMLSGDMDSMAGVWQFTALTPDETRFDSMMEYEYDVPLIGPMVKNLIRKKMTENLSSTMEAIRARAEAS